jgi:hypothetical protein
MPHLHATYCAKHKFLATPTVDCGRRYEVAESEPLYVTKIEPGRVRLRSLWNPSWSIWIEPERLARYCDYLCAGDNPFKSEAPQPSAASALSVDG